jgi:hypothetical protein
MGAQQSVFDAMFEACDQSLSGGECEADGARKRGMQLDGLYNELVTRVSDFETKLWVVVASTLQYLSRERRNLFAPLVHKVQIEYAEKIIGVCASLLTKFQTHFASAILASDAQRRADGVEARVDAIQAVGNDDSALMPSLRECFIRKARSVATNPGAIKASLALKPAVGLSRRKSAPPHYLYAADDVCSMFFDLLDDAAAREDFLFFGRVSNLIVSGVISLPYYPESERALLGSTVFVQMRSVLENMSKNMCREQDDVDDYLRGLNHRLTKVGVVLDELQGCASCLKLDKLERQMIQANASN